MRADGAPHRSTCTPAREVTRPPRPCSFALACGPVSSASPDGAGRAAEETPHMSRRGWIVVLAGTGLNLALGILYAWSVFSKQLVETVERGGYGWTKTSATLPYTVAIACFALMMVPAGPAAGQARAAHRRVRRRDPHRPRPRRRELRVARHDLAGAARLRPPRRHRVRPRLLFHHAGGVEVVPAREEGAHHRHRGRRLRPRASVHRAALEAPHRARTESPARSASSGSRSS